MGRLRWSHAGHPPPLLIEPDGGARVLTRPAELLLGLRPDSERGDHSVELSPGATVLLYADGLVEPRGEALDDGLARLVEHATARAGLPLEQLCGALSEQLAGSAEAMSRSWRCARTRRTSRGPRTADGRSGRRRDPRVRRSPVLSVLHGTVVASTGTARLPLGPTRLYQAFSTARRRSRHG